MKKVITNVIDLLENNNIEYELLEHEPVYTCEDAAKVRGAPIRAGVKALVLKTHEKKFIVALVRADKRADLQKIAELEGTREVRLADPRDVLEVTGCEVGSVPPFGHFTPLRTYFDREILENEYVNFSCGEHTKSIKMKAEDLPKLIKNLHFF